MNETKATNDPTAPRAAFILSYLVDVHSLKLCLECPDPHSKKSDIRNRSKLWGK